MAAGKRKRGAGSSERDKFEHKSATLLQREAKKVRTFLARKAVQQLKQQQQQQQSTTDVDAAKAAKAAKQQEQTQKRERELAALKALDLKQVVARAFEVTGLKRDPSAVEEDHDAVSDESDAEMPAMADSDSDSDGGFDSEEYENAKGIGAGGSAVKEEVKEEKEVQPEPNVKQQAEAVKLNAVLVERILAHKQVAPLLDAIRQWLKTEEREEEKRVRRQEKRALKRGRKEVLVGGRSASAPMSMFLGSLSGRGGLEDMDDDAGGSHAGHMAGADDDIAEFLGETKKKNRPGQMARRQKAIRQEEARKRKEDRERGVFRPFHREATGADGRGVVMGKYGPSERPKKPKKPGKDKDKGKDRKQGGGRSTTRKPGLEASVRQPVKDSQAVEVAHPSWIAKQAQKEKERVSIAAFSGKKITFD